MNQDRYSRDAVLEARRRGRRRRRAAAALSVALAGVLLAGGTLAYIVTKTVDVENAFTPGIVSCEVVETFEDGDAEKKNVTVKNTGSADAYVRAAISVSWVAADDPLGKEGDVHGSSLTQGEDGDYVLTTGSNWTLRDGFYYYKGEVAGGASTTDLIVSCAPVAGKAPAGYVLQVDVIASAVQADGVDAKGNKAVELAWGVDFNGSGVTDATVSK